MAVDTFFGIIDSIGGQLTTTLDAMSMALTAEPGRTLVTNIILLMLVIEIVFALIMALSDSGQKAVSLGVQAIIITSFIYSVTSSGSWGIIRDIAKNFPNELTSTLIPGTSDSLKTDLANQFASIIRQIMDPSLIQPSHGVTPSQPKP